MKTALELQAELRAAIKARLLNPAEAEAYHYPDARSWMWNYCLFLGKFTNSEGRNYDLGVHITSDGELDKAIVCSNEPGDYESNSVAHIKHYPKDVQKEPWFEASHELLRRLEARGFYTGPAR